MAVMFTSFLPQIGNGVEKIWFHFPISGNAVKHFNVSKKIANLASCFENHFLYHVTQLIYILTISFSLIQAAMETVHGQKLASLLGELLQPFDLGRKLQVLLVLCKKLWVVLVLHFK